MSGAASLSAARRRRAGGAQIPPSNTLSNNNNVRVKPTQQQQKQPQQQPQKQPQQQQPQQQNKNINPLQLLSIHHSRLDKIETFMKRFEPLLSYYESLSVLKPVEKVTQTVKNTDVAEIPKTPIQLLGSHNKRLNEIDAFISKFEKLLISENLQNLSVDNLILHIKEKGATRDGNTFAGQTQETAAVPLTYDANNF